MYDTGKWCWKHIVPSDRKGWSWFVISTGDVRNALTREHSLYLQKRLDCKTVRDSLCTVVYMRDGDVAKWKRTGGARALRNCILTVLCEEDGRRFFPVLFSRADATDEIRAKTMRRNEAGRKRNLHIRERDDVSWLFSSRSTIRGAARDSL